MKYRYHIVLFGVAAIAAVLLSSCGKYVGTDDPETKKSNPEKTGITFTFDTARDGGETDTQS